MYQKRTDLALEAHEMRCQQEKRTDNKIDGVAVETEEKEDVTITRVKVLNETGVQKLNKPVGNYVTIDAPHLKSRDPELYLLVETTLKEELDKLYQLDENAVSLVVGLGNWNITPDALGPKVVSSVLVSRHLKEYLPDKIDDRIRPACAIAPGVMGITGIETGEIIKGVVEKIKPSLVIVIDALASMKMERVSTSIQLSDTGITPGSGVGNARKALNEETLGCKVIAIGVPMVVDAATIAIDTIDKVLQKSSEQYLTEEQKSKLVETILSPYDENVMVTPKEIDVLIDDVSKIIANGINLSLHRSMTLDEINLYL